MISLAAVQAAIRKFPPNDPRRAELLDLYEIEACEHSLAKFVYFAWPILHDTDKPYVHGYHVDAICEHLEAVTAGHITRLIINIPPGFLKSILVNIFWPAWEWGPKRLPQLQYVSFAYADELTIRDNRRMRQVITSPWYTRRWGHLFSLVGDQNSKTRFDNNRNGYKIATSVNGTGTGQRGDRLIGDDLNNVKKAESEKDRLSTAIFVREVMPTRVNDRMKSAIINVQQRTNEGDATGILLSGDYGYVHLCLPMRFDPKRRCVIDVTGFRDRRKDGDLLWPEGMPETAVQAEEKILGPYAVAGQHDQNPVPRGGGMFKLEWWRFYETGRYGRPVDTDTSPAVSLPETFDAVIITCDPKFKKNPSRSRVGLFTLGFKGPNVYVLEDRTDNYSPSETAQAVYDMHRNYPFATVLIEEAAAGTAIIEVLKMHITGVVEVRPDGGKEARAAAAEATFKSHCVFLPEGAHWLDPFCAEFAGFPTATFKDRVDALCQAIIHWLTNMEDLRTFMAMAKMGDLYT